MSRPTSVHPSRRPIRRDITVTATSVVSRNTLPSGEVRTHEFWVADGVLWQSTPDGSTIKHTVMTAHLRKLLNDNR